METILRNDHSKDNKNTVLNKPYDHIDTNVEYYEKTLGVSLKLLNLFSIFV